LGCTSYDWLNFVYMQPDIRNECYISDCELRQQDKQHRELKSIWGLDMIYKLELEVYNSKLLKREFGIL
jgi:hypothetical protein